MLLGLGGVLKTIGRRSLAYRRSHAARQSVHTMLAALAGIAVGELVRWLAAAQQSNVWMVRGTILFSASGLMIIIGLLYMVGNAWWIRADLRRPPPVLDQLLLPNLPRDTRVPGVEDDGDEGKENAELP